MNSFLKQELRQFTGSDVFYKHWSGFVYTEGIKYLAEKAEAYWLIDAIASYQGELWEVDTQFWTLTLTECEGAVLEMREDSHLPVLVRQEIEWTDFPIKTITLFLINNTLHLPSEY